tara:strand:+ start:1175 stop:1594 length:420 start_codon:yes stop_codon:yes gene_type:complete
MWSMEYDTGTGSGRYSWGDNDVSFYKTSEHPTHFDFTFDEVERLGHDAGTAGTHWYLTVEKDLGNGRSRKFYGIGIHVDEWLKLFKREMDRVRNQLQPTRYIAVRARDHYWVEPKLCNPVIDSSLYPASQKVNQKKMVA